MRSFPRLALLIGLACSTTSPPGKPPGLGGGGEGGAGGAPLDGAPPDSPMMSSADVALPPTGSAPGECARLFDQGARSEWVYYDAQGKLAYKPLNPEGDRIMDFSHAGYMGGGVALPMVPVVQMVRPSGGDDTAAIQAAIDAVASRPLAERGAVLLAPGHFRSASTISITASGVVLRGSGSAEGGTELELTSSHMFLRVAGTGSAVPEGPTASVTDEHVPAGARSFTVGSAAGFKVGDSVLVGRPITAAWVQFMGRDANWIAPGSTYYWERTITALDGGKVTVDVPLSDSLDGKMVKPPGASLQKYSFPGRISQVGLEALRVLAPVRTGSSHHQLLEMTATMDSWVRDVEGRNMVQGIHIEVGSRRITLENARIIHDPTDYFSEAAPFDFNVNAAEVLVHRSASKGGYKNMMYTTHRAQGPNVVLDFQGDGRQAHIQPHMKWATGLLVDGAIASSEGTKLESAIALMNRGNAGNHHGWAIGWGVAWNCTAPSVLLQKPPGSMVWAIGCKTTPSEPASSVRETEIYPTGTFESVNAPVSPRSLYLAQLCERLGPKAVANLGY